MTLKPVCSASKSLSNLTHTIVLTFYRQEHTTGTRKRVTKYSITTGTGVLRNHLLDHHADAWIAGCDKLNIPITAKSAQSKVKEYRTCHGQPPNTCESEQANPRRAFSQEAFVEAIVEFIVADDQVGGEFVSFNNLFICIITVDQCY